MAFTTSHLRAMFTQVQQLRQSGQAAAANILAGQVLGAVATGADDLYCQASLLMAANRPTEALARFEKARSLGPVPAELLVDRAVALSQLGRLDEALVSCEMALGVQRDFAPAHLIQGDCLRDLGRAEEALAQYDLALRAQKDMVPALCNRADLLQRLKRFDEALKDLDRLARLTPNDAVILNARGNVLGELNRFEEALASFDRALALQPRNARVLHNRGVVLWNLERFEEALDSYEKSLAIAPNSHITLSNRANTLQELLRLDDAMAAHDQVVRMAPEFPSGHWNRSQGLLLRGNWKDGLREFEWRKLRPESAADYQVKGGPEWLGAESIAGKTLLIRAEMGFGDTLQFVRYAALAQERGARVILAAQPPLVDLLRESLVPPVDAVVARTETLPDFDFHIPSMSLPLAFGTDIDNVPAPIPYLKANAARVAAWSAKLGTDGFKIGISWRGGGRGPGDVGRAFSPLQLAPLAGLPGVRLISLQKGEAALAQLRDAPMAVEVLEDFDEDGGAFLDTAAVMQHCDLVISSDTAVAHLAGALGRPTWLALKYVPEWRWQLQGDTTPWYPGMRLFRQKTVGVWDDVFAAMEAALAAQLG